MQCKKRLCVKRRRDKCWFLFTTQTLSQRCSVLILAPGEMHDRNKTIHLTMMLMIMLKLKLMLNPHCSWSSHRRKQGQRFEDYNVYKHEKEDFYIFRTWEGLHFKSDKAATERYASSMNDYSLSFLGWEVNTKSPFEDSFGGRAVKNEVSKMSGDSVKCTLSPNWWS